MKQNTKYTSDSMEFIKTLLNKPGQHEQQMALRNTWWDKDFIDLEEQQAYQEAALKHDAYVYFSYPQAK